jgi:hypothetical protein
MRAVTTLALLAVVVGAAVCATAADIDASVPHAASAPGAPHTQRRMLKLKIEGKTDWWFGTNKVRAASGLALLQKRSAAVVCSPDTRCCTRTHSPQVESKFAIPPEPKKEEASKKTAATSDSANTDSTNNVRVVCVRA